MGDAPRKWTAELDTQLTSLHGEGLSLNECARRIGWSSSAIHAKAKKLGLTWDRTSHTAAANKARRDRAQEIRDQNELRYAEASVTYYDAMEQPCVATFAGVEYTLTRPLPSDRRAFAQMSLSFHKASQEIADRHSGRGVEVGKSMLGRLALDIGGALADDLLSRPELASDE